MTMETSGAFAEGRSFPIDSSTRAPQARQRSDETNSAAALRSMLRPLHKRLAAWQSRTVWLAAMDAASRHEKIAETAPSARDMLNEAIAARDGFRTAVAGFRGVEAASRIADTERAFANMIAALTKLAGKGDSLAVGAPLAQSVTMAANCPRCGTMNTLTVLHTSFDERVSCSHCGAMMGTVGDLEAGAVNPAAVAAE